MSLTSSPLCAAAQAVMPDLHMRTVDDNDRAGGAPAPLIATFVGSTAVIGTAGKHVGMRPTRTGRAARLGLALGPGRCHGTRTARRSGLALGMIGWLARDAREPSFVFDIKFRTQRPGPYAARTGRGARASRERQ